MLKQIQNINKNQLISWSINSLQKQTIYCYLTRDINNNKFNNNDQKLFSTHNIKVTKYLDQTTLTMQSLETNEQ